MALRFKTKWHRGGPKTLADRAGVVGFNLWKVAYEAFRRMEREEFSMGGDEQVTAVVGEWLAFLLQMSDRLVYGQMSEEDRATLINALGRNLADTMESNMADLFGPGDWRGRFIGRLNQRLADYAEFEFDPGGDNYAARRYVAEKVAEALTGMDTKWVIEQVIDIETPEAIRSVKRVVREVLGLKAP